MPNQFTGKHHGPRFWAKVQKTDACWMWTAGTFRTGYGQFQLHGRPNGAHRVAWELVNGPVAPGFYVCHTCDNPACVRPDHLFLGSPLDNIVDAQVKHRKPTRTKFPLFLGQKGERQPRAKLTDDAVREIRKRYASGGTSYPKLAREFGVSFGVIARVVTRRSWQHV